MSRISAATTFAGVTIDLLRVLKTIPKRKITSQILSARCSDFQVNLPPQLPAISSDELIAGSAGRRRDMPFLTWSAGYPGLEAHRIQHKAILP